MNIAFWDNQLCERGTTTALFDYAYFNQTVLNNNSYIFYDKNSPSNNIEIIDKFKKYFTVTETNNFNEVDSYLLKYNITHIYIIKSGEKDDRISKVAKNCIHCVFNCYSPHGEVYASVSQNVAGNNGKYPVVPHMINLPEHNSNLREKLGIPTDGIVFGGYGGRGQFDISYVHKVVYEVAKNNQNIYFLFANFNRFCPSLPNIIHLPMITDLSEKVTFINTCDAMIHGRSDGETFGLAVGEFSSKNKPVITTKCGDLAHIHLLGEKCIIYNKDCLLDILLNFNPLTEKNKNWNAYETYSPENVITIFKEAFLT
jgi:hypothetical protein